MLSFITFCINIFIVHSYAIDLLCLFMRCILFIFYFFKALKRFESLKAVCKVPTNIINISEQLWLGLALELSARYSVPIIIILLYAR